MDDFSSFTTSSTNDDFVFESYPQRIVIASILCLVTVVGIVGNSHVVLAVLLCQKLRSSTNWLVVNLGMADLITCLFLPFNVVAMLSKNGWPIAEWICAMTGGVTLTCLGTSIISLALIAHNRWVLLTRPRYTFYSIYSRRNIVAMVILSWMYPLLLVIVPPMAGLGKLGYSENYKTCQQDTSLSNSDYYSLIAAVGVIVPASIIIVVMYVLIYRSVSRHNKAMGKRLAESREAGTSSFDRTSLDMSTSWTESRDRQRSVVTDGSRATSGVGMRPTLPNSRNMDGAPTLTGPVNLAPSNDEGDESQHNVSHVPETTRPCSEVFEPGVLALGEIELSNVNSQAENTVSINDHRISQENLENSSTSSNHRRAPQASTHGAKGSTKSAPKISRHHINVTKRLSLVVLSFFICFLPFGICVMVPTSDPAVPWANLLIMFNTCINPILYAGTMPMFREVMGCIARCRFQSIPEPVDLVRFCRGPT
ncbi:muscarinic acetylcholine receptor M4-like [Strongylocentrotus purpuratus]|uniref:G-protein coupled receptors family 1 profile domain-containing protein n=1 Tax=Strongylocentrotus purpuratus TaxID=7668 RepID=A0A7M7T1J2_STRPU|nr:muscarinic acetylcholine receptor M4-like [Strongylocentrotus purpuratus]